jgi:hypothetical protein
MNSSIESFVPAARFKAAASIAAVLIFGLLASLLVAGLTSATKKPPQHAAPGKGSARSAKNNPEPPASASTPDAEIAPDSISVQIVAPKLTTPLVGTSTASITPPAAPLTQAENESRPARSPQARPARQIDIKEAVTAASEPEPTQPNATEVAATPEGEPNTKTNAEPLVAVNCSYEFAAVQKSLQTGRGELVALCRRPGASNTLMVIDRTAGATYQLRKSTTSDNLANLGLRLQVTDGDLPNLERRIRTQTGVEAVTFYFAPSGDFARLIIGAQQSALEAFRRTRKAAPAGTVVLNARFCCASNGIPSYTITGIALASAGSASLHTLNEQIALGESQAEARH